MVKPDGVQRGLVGEIIKRSAALEADGRGRLHTIAHVWLLQSPPFMRVTFLRFFTM